ncbi:MAG: leucine-rich repeat domain-containing protein [Clostridia bacterium]|nr:leucine-rich repeat domain-containing protein [Clostridia bacterium]
MKSSKMKKVLLTMLALVAIFMLFSVTAYAEEYGNFSYTLVQPEEGEDFESYIKIVGYNLNDAKEGEAIVMPDNIDDVPVTIVAASAFAGKNVIGEVIIPEGITTIENAAFRNCADLKVVIIPDSVTSIGESAFQGCASLEYVIIGNGVKTIGDIAFKDCPALKVVSLGTSVETIGAGAFYGCPELKLVRVPASVKNIESLAFGFVQNGNIETAVDGFTFCCDAENAVVESYVAKYSVADSEDVSSVPAAALTIVNNSAVCDSDKYVTVRTATETFDGLDLAACDTCGAVVTRPNTDVVAEDAGSSALVSLIVILVLVIAFAVLVVVYVKNSKKRREASIEAYKNGKPMPDAEAKERDEKKAADKYAKKRAKQEAHLRKYIDM